MVVPFMMLAQSRMHGLKKKKENGMIEPDVDKHPVFCIICGKNPATGGKTDGSFKEKYDF